MPNILFAKRKINNVIGVARLIPENPDGLFMDQFINSKNYISMPSDVNQNGKFIELSEFITHKDERRNSRIIYMLIIYSAWYILKSNQYNRAASISTRSVHELLKRLGFEKRPVEFLSEWGGVMTLHTLDFSKLNMNELERISKKLGIENFSI